MPSPDLSAGELWLAQQPARARKERGQWATPWWVVDAVCARVCSDLAPGALVVDPACGDGRWLAGVARHAPQARLLGIDIDANAITAARQTLARAGVDAELIEGDALTVGFPRADLVVGNPPYVRTQNLPEAVRRDLWARYRSATDKTDLYACFVEHILDHSERSALVLPDGWLHLNSYAALRQRVLEADVDAVFSLPRDTFRDADVPTVLLLAGGPSRQVGTLTREGFGVTGALHAGPLAWSLVGPPPELPGRPFSELATIHMGIVCGDYARYVHDGHRFPEDRPTCRGRHVQRWQIQPTDEHVRYLPRDMLDRKPYVAPKHAGLFDVACKIVLAGTTGTAIRAAMDLERRFPLDSCYVIHAREGVDPWGLLGVLLSPQVEGWYGARHRAPRVKGVEVARIPVPGGDWSDIAAAARARDEAGLKDAVERAYS